MLTVETIGRIRRERLLKGKSIKEIARDLKVSRNTVRKVLRSGATAFEYEREVLAALELDLLSPAAIQHATNLAMEYFNKQRKPEPVATPALSATLAEIDKRESEVRDPFKSGKLPASVFKSWLGEFTREREALNRSSVSEAPPRVSRSETEI